MPYLRSISAISERTSFSLAFLASVPIIVFIHRIEINTPGHKLSNLELFRKHSILDKEIVHPGLIKSMIVRT